MRSGYDDISNVLLKKLIVVTKEPLCIVFNKSLTTGQFPDLLKIAKVQPLYKSGERYLADNYRLISLLPVISKILERIVYDATMEYFEANNILYVKQFGFRKKHSTIDAICNFVGEILKCFEELQMVLSIFIDLHKAFDSVSHSLILHKLSALGIQDEELKWFESYLTGCKQFTQMQNCRPAMAEMSVGIPQGALLGVLLFQVHVNDLNKCLMFSNSILYADDTTIYVMGKSPKYLRFKLQDDLNSLLSWLRVNKLKLNTKKTKVLLFNKDGLFPNVELSVYNDTIECVTYFKFLGVWLDHTLSFDHHYMHLHEKLLKSKFIVRCLAETLPTSCLKHLYYAYYNSHLVYGLAIWYPILRKTDQQSLYVMQKGLVRKICKVSSTQHCMPLFRQLGVLTIDDLASVESIKLYHRVLTLQCSVTIRNLYRKNEHQYDTRMLSRSATHFRTMKVNKSFLCKPVVLWEHLDSNLKGINNIKLCARKIKTNFIRKY